MDPERIRRWAEHPNRVPLESLAYKLLKCDPDTEPLRQYVKWLPLVRGYLQSGESQRDVWPPHFREADITKALMSWCDSELEPNPAGFSVVLKRYRYQCELRQLRELDQVATEPAGHSLGVETTEMRPENKRSCRQPCLRIDEHRELIKLAALALTTGDVGEFCRHYDLALPDQGLLISGELGTEDTRNNALRWPAVLQPARILAALDWNFLTGGDMRRSRKHAAAGVLACILHAHGKVIANSEDMGIYIMDTMKEIADDAMAKWRPYLDAEEDGAAVVRAKLAHEVFLAPLHQKHLGSHSVRLAPGLTRAQAREIEKHACERVIRALRAQSIDESTAHQYFQLVLGQIVKIQDYNQYLLAMFDIGSGSPLCVACRLLHAKCSHVPAQMGLSLADFFLFATMPTDVLLSELTFYVEQTYGHLQPSQFIDDDRQFWGGFVAWRRRLKQLKHTYCCGHAMVECGGGLSLSAAYRCKRCNSAKTELTDAQVRAADEQRSYGLLCLNCLGGAGGQA